MKRIASASMFRRTAAAEEMVLRACMPAIAAKSPEPIKFGHIEQPKLVKPLTFKIAEVARA